MTASVPSGPRRNNSATMNALAAAWFANCGRQPSREEAAEFHHAFEESDPVLVRRAIDEYATTGPEFMRLAGLRAVHAKLVTAIRTLDGSKAGEAERQDAERWVRAKGYEAHGFKFAEAKRVLTPREVRALVARHSNARNDHGCCRSLKTWNTDKSAEAREVMRVCRFALEEAGYGFVGFPSSPAGHVEIEFDAQGWWPRLVPPTGKSLPNVANFAAEDVARDARAFKELEAEVEKWRLQ